MRFHKIEMVGKFILQKVDSLPAFNFERDQGRLVYNLTDDKVYQGSNAEWTVAGATGDTPTGDINTDSPDAGKVIYYDGNLYYGNGSSWNMIGGGSGDTPTGDITTDTPTEGSLIYDDGNLYYGDGVQWNLIGGGGTATGDITTDSPDVGKIIYDDGNLYYGDGSSWNIVITEDTVDTNLSSYTNQYTETSSWTVNHNLDGYANLIQCFNTSHQAITPNSITQNSTNTLTITFPSPQEGYVTVINVGDFTFVDPGTPVDPGTSQTGIFMGNSTSWNINHGFDTNYLIVDTWDDSGTLSEKNIANSTIINDSNNITVDWDGTVVDGHISVIAVDDGTGQYRASQTSAAQWNVNHGLNSNEIIVQCWDGAGNLIHPNYIEKTDNNNLVVDFDGVNTNGSICIISTDMTITDGGTYFNSLSAAGTWSITHSLSSQNLIVQVWSANRVVSEYTTTINNDNTITIDFDGSSVAGDVMIIKVS